MVQKLFAAVGVRRGLLPFLFFLITAGVAAMGSPQAGYVVMPLAMPVARRSGVDPRLMAVAINGGISAGGLAPTSLFGIVTNSTARQGVCVDHEDPGGARAAGRAASRVRWRGRVGIDQRDGRVRVDRGCLTLLNHGCAADRVGRGGRTTAVEVVVTRWGLSLVIVGPEVAALGLLLLIMISRTWGESTRWWTPVAGTEVPATGVLCRLQPRLSRRGRTAAVEVVVDALGTVASDCRAGGRGTRTSAAWTFLTNLGSEDDGSWTSAIGV